MINSGIGNGVASIRKQKNIEQSELAKKIGVSQPVISRLERGKAQWTIERLLAVCSALEINQLEFQVNGINILNFTVGETRNDNRKTTTESAV